MCEDQNNIKLNQTSDNNEPGGIENATHNTLEHKPGCGGDKYSASPNNYTQFHINVHLSKQWKSDFLLVVKLKLVTLTFKVACSARTRFD
jgi:hypothetical protein